MESPNTHASLVYWHGLWKPIHVWQTCTQYSSLRETWLISSSQVNSFPFSPHFVCTLSYFSLPWAQDFSHKHDWNIAFYSQINSPVLIWFSEAHLEAHFARIDFAVFYNRDPFLWNFLGNGHNTTLVWLAPLKQAHSTKNHWNGGYIQKLLLVWWNMLTR